MFSLVICIKDPCNKNEFIEPFPHPPPWIPAFFFFFFFFFAFWQQEPTNYLAQIYEHKQKQNINIKLIEELKNYFYRPTSLHDWKKQTIN